MDKYMVVDFNTAYGRELTAEEEQTVNDMLGVWGKLETSVSKNPALVRKGIVFGMGLAAGIQNGAIKLRKPRPKKVAKASETGME